jgi:hypothetical protein
LNKSLVQKAEASLLTEVLFLKPEKENCINAVPGSIPGARFGLLE